MASIICQYLQLSYPFFTTLTVWMHASPRAWNLNHLTPGVEKDVLDDNFEFEGFHFLLVLLMIRTQDYFLTFSCFGSESETPMMVALHSFLKEYKWEERKEEERNMSLKQRHRDLRTSARVLKESSSKISSGSKCRGDFGQPASSKCPPSQELFCSFVVHRWC